MNKRFSLTNEKYTAVADFMLVSFERDLAEFTKVFKTINQEYLEAFKKANEDLKNAESTLGKRQEQKRTTQELYAKADAFKDKLSLLKMYAKRAQVETPLLQETIKALKNKNIEKAVKNTREMLVHFVQSKAQLVDMPDDFLDDIPATLTAMEECNTQQNTLMNQRKETTAGTKNLYASLYKYLSEVADAGKFIYKGQSKKDEYTITKILRRLQASKSITKTTETASEKKESK